MKKIFSYILTVVIVLSMLQLVGVAAYSDYTVQPTVTLFGEGTEELTPTLLSDGFRYTYKDYVTESKTPSANLEKFIKFTDINSGAQFEWTEKQVVNRLEVWIWRLGAINEYEVQTSENGTVWNTVKTGSFDQTVQAPKDANSFNAYAEFVSFDSVYTKYLRFVIKSFKEDTNGAYISEIIPRNGTPANLTATEKSGNTNYAPYAELAQYSNTHSWSDNQWGGAAWLFNSAGTRQQIKRNSDGSCYYAVSFSTPKRVSRVKVTLAAGTLTGYEVYYSNSAVLTTKAAPVMSDWTKAAEENVNLGAWENSHTDIPNAPTAKYWMVKIKNPSSSIGVYSIAMYDWHDPNATAPVITKSESTAEADIVLTHGTAKTGSTGNDSDITITKNYKIYAAVFNANNSLQRIDSITDASVVTFVPTIEKITVDNLKDGEYVKLFVWEDGKLTPYPFK